MLEKRCSVDYYSTHGGATRRWGTYWQRPTSAVFPNMRKNMFIHLTVLNDYFLWDNIRGIAQT